MTQKRRETVHFSQQVPANSVETLTREMPADATVERIDVRIYPGAELDLRIRPFIDRERAPDSSRRESLVTYRGRDYLVGDDDVMSLPVTRPVEEGESIGVEAENRDGSNAYDYRVAIVYDTLGGLERVVTAAQGVLG